MSARMHFSDNPKLDPVVGASLTRIGYGLGVAGLLVSLGLGFGVEGNQKQFYFSWLTAFLWMVTLTAGALFFVVLHHLVRANWSTALRRTAENIAANMPLMALLFVPVLIGSSDLFHWSHADVVAADPSLQYKSGYLNMPFFIGRAVVFLILWIAIAFFYRKHSLAQDESGDVGLTFKMRRFAPVATLVWAMSLTFAMFDWSMSLDPHWFSTIYGVINFAGSMMACYAALALASLWLTKNGALTRTYTVDNFHDVGKLMWGFTIFWTYTSFSQYFLIWYGNIPEETIWFVVRQSNGWMALFLTLVLGHFIFPFWFLMSRHMKRGRKTLGIGAVWLLLMHYCDHYVMVMPNLHHHLHFHILDVTCLVAIGGLSVGAWAQRTAKVNLVPIKDPQLDASMSYDNAV
ncbi:MAG: hypothetical protein EXR76_09870 [Myxococcales bacterium]|nr:hypothetical protein [Myxococcales bacterium]